MKPQKYFLRYWNIKTNKDAGLYMNTKVSAMYADLIIAEYGVTAKTLKLYKKEA